MKAFTFVRPGTVEEAAKAAAVKGSVIKAGGIDLLDRMKERVDEPERVVWLGDVSLAAMHEIAVHGDGPNEALRIGGAVTLAEIAESPLVRKHAQALAEAAASAASPQIRARATLAGNLCQHSRCGYYRHKSFPCFKRGDATCPVLSEGAVQETAAIFGNAQCASAHPSSLAPALAACGADLRIQKNSDEPWNQTWLYVPTFFAAPRRGIASDTTLAPGDVLVCASISLVQTLRVSVFEEVRQKSSFDWALVSCAASFGQLHRDAKTPLAYFLSLWLGGVAPIPWRVEAEDGSWQMGRPLTDETIAAAADAAVAGATPLPGNAYKVDLVKVVVRRALERLRSAK